MSAFISWLLSKHTGINDFGNSLNPNANFSYMCTTFDCADCDAMYTNKAIEMTQALKDANKPPTLLQNVTIYLSTGSACN